MNTWTTYFIERFNPILLLPAVIGMALSGVLLDRHLFRPGAFTVIAITVFIIAFVLRLRNDIADYEKDRIAFRKRPLPRGLISKEEARRTLDSLNYALALYFVILFIFYWANTRLAILLTALYLWLLLHDFYAREWLERRPFLAGLIRQGFFFVLAVLAVSIGRPGLAFAAPGLFYALVVFSSFFIFAICRKLDPFAHPISMALVHYYGFRKTFWIVCLLALLSAIGAFGLGVARWLLPAQFLVILTLSLLFWEPKLHRLPKFAAGLSLLIHTWAGPIQHL